MPINPFDFINTYRPFYFDNNNNEGKVYLGIPKNLATGDINVELYVENHLINQGVYNEFALAWKSGKLFYNDINHYLYWDDSFVIDNTYRNGYGSPISINEFNVYCDELERFTNNEYSLAQWDELYRRVVSVSPNNLGPVYIITSLFFKSSGRIPIYDQFVHKALKSLAIGIAPGSVFYGNTPSKNNINSVKCMFNEYLYLLESIFPEAINHDGAPFISRALDQALWVYGHCSRGWHELRN